jgi:peptidoglycan/xylan/chitin deacetylase (PgdA/CDA1 family)/glycosyltransferase involved in cell wall biosynthesis
MIELSVIVISVHDGTESLHTCLEALRLQTHPACAFEVIVVVGGSADGGGGKAVEHSVPYTLRTYYQNAFESNGARNLGLENADGSYCLFLDDDMIPDPGLVEAHLRVQQEREGVIGIGHLSITTPSSDEFARCVLQSRLERSRQLAEGVRPPTLMDCQGGNLSVPRRAALEVGGFASDMERHAEIDLACRLADCRLPLVYIPQAIAHQKSRTTGRQIATGAEQAGATDIALYRRHPRVLPHLEAGAFSDSSPRAILLRRALLAVDAPVRPLLMVGHLLRRHPWVCEWYGFLHSYCYWRGVRHSMLDQDTWRRLTHGTPILMYHAIGYPGEPASRYILPRRRFALQMAWLKWRRYHVLSLEELLRHRAENRLPPCPSVVITLDDGYADNWSIAFPILGRYGLPATIFVVSGLVGAANAWDSAGELAGRALLSWSNIKEMLAGGMHFGAHTRTHTSVTAVPRTQAEREVAGARADLEGALRVPIRTFSYPNGRYDGVAEGVVQRAGFLGACCSRAGVNEPATPLFALRRTEIRGTDSLLRFVSALWFGKTRFRPTGRSIPHGHVRES